MKRSVKTLFSLLLCLALTLSLLSVPGLAMDPASGVCGAAGNEDAVTWSFDSRSGRLTVSGTGAMADFELVETDYELTAVLPWKAREIKEVVIEEGVTHLGAHAFYEAGNLRSVSLPASLDCIGEQALARCMNLATVTLAAGNTAFCVEDGVLLTADRSVLLLCPARREGTSYTVPAAVREIADYAFYRSALTEIALPEGLTHICRGAFDSASALTELTLPAGITVIEEGTFRSCGRLERITLPEGITRIGSSAFSGCSRLVWEALPATLEEIGELAFVSNVMPTELDLPEGLKRIGQQAFASCTPMELVRFPASVETIGENLFYFVTTLKRVEVDPDNPSLCAVDGVLFSKDMSLLYRYPAAKEGESYVIPTGVRRVGVGAFERCAELFELTVPEGVEELGDTALYSACRLVRVELPVSLKKVGLGVFKADYPNYLLSDVYYRGSQEQYEAIEFDRLNPYAIYFNTRIHYGEAMPAYGPSEVIASGSCSTGLSWSLSFGGDLRIEGAGATPAATETNDYGMLDYSPIDWYEWSGYIRRIRIGEGVTGIGRGAFEICYNAEAVSIPRSVVSIDHGAFPADSVLSLCKHFSTVYYAGSEAEWEAVEGTAAYRETWQDGHGEWHTGMLNPPLFYRGVYDEELGETVFVPCVTFRFGETLPETADHDLDGDGLVTAADAGLLFAYVSGSPDPLPEGAEPDLDGDGKINDRDAILLFRLAKA